MLRAASQHTAPPPFIPAHREGKFHLGHSCQPCPLHAPCSTPNPAGPWIQERTFSRDALPGSRMTWAMGMLKAVLDQHPSSGFIPELLSSLSHVVSPLISLFPKPRLHLIILLPALSGSPSPAITPDNCELSGGHGQQSGSSTWETAASTDISLPSSPPPLPLLVQLWESWQGCRQGRGLTRPNPPKRSCGHQAHSAPSSEGCLQLRDAFGNAPLPFPERKLLCPKAGGSQPVLLPRGPAHMGTNRFQPHPEQELNGTIWHSGSSSPSHWWGKGNPGREAGHAAGTGTSPGTGREGTPPQWPSRAWGPSGSQHIPRGRAGHSPSLQRPEKAFCVHNYISQSGPASTQSCF